MNYSSVKQGAPNPDRSSQAAREELRRIVSSPVFEDAERLVRFLTFVVEESLAGRGGILKEAIIGVEVFGRAPAYDPKIDPIVRVQARRLRSKLESWYETGGRTSAVRIGLPKGGYAPEFGPPPAPEQPSVVAAPRARWARIALPVAAVLLLGTAAVILTSSKPKTAAPGSRLFTAYRGYQTTPAFSPDGRAIAFSWGGPDGDNVDIYVQSLDADTPRRLTTSPQRERSPVWLADGQHIGFLRDAGPDRFAVMVVPLQGAGERQVAEIRGNLNGSPGIEWTHDGTSIITSEPVAGGTSLEIVGIDLKSGARRRLIPALSQAASAGSPGDDEVALSPDGKWLAFRRRTASVVGDVFVAPSGGGEPRAITHDRTGITGLAWARDGRSLIVSSQRQSTLVRLWRFPVNGQPPVCLTDAALAASYPAVSPLDGQIAFASRFFDTNIWRIDLQGDSPQQRLIASNLLDSSPQYSPDGQRIAFRSNRTGNDEIWTADAAGRSPVRLTNFGGPVTGSPHWSPDGQYLVFDSRPDGSADIFVIPAGGGASRKLTSETSNEVTPNFSADGKSVYFASDRTGNWQVWKQPIEGGAARQITGKGGFAPQESADGKWVYYAKLDAGGLFRTAVEGGEESNVLPSLPSGLWGGWALAGTHKVFYAALPERNQTVPAELRILDLDTGKTRTMGGLSFPPPQWDGSVAISPDGRYALVTELERQGSEIHLQPDP
jgi:Tol biopolymer transport system component